MTASNGSPEHVLGVGPVARITGAPRNRQYAAGFLAVITVTSAATEKAIECRPALQIFADKAAEHVRARAHRTYYNQFQRRKFSSAVRLFAKEKPSSYCTWVGLEQDNDAMQTNRAVCYLLRAHRTIRPARQQCALRHHTDQSDQRPRAISERASGLRLGLDSHPLGPPADPGLVQAAEVYDAILTEHPYPVRALVLFGSDPLLGHGDPLRGKAALEALDFYVHVDTTLNPSAAFADLLLPATTCWEREALMPLLRNRRRHDELGTAAPGGRQSRWRVALRYRRSSSTWPERLDLHRTFLRRRDRSGPRLSTRAV